jgi:hypothetical protein
MYCRVKELGMIEAVRTSETSVDNYFTRQYIPEDNPEHHTRRRENFKSHMNQLYLRVPAPFSPGKKPWVHATTRSYMI